jgi:hypothetical protein
LTANMACQKAGNIKDLAEISTDRQFVDKEWWSILLTPVFQIKIKSYSRQQPFYRRHTKRSRPTWRLYGSNSPPPLHRSSVTTHFKNITRFSNS